MSQIPTTPGPVIPERPPPPDISPFPPGGNPNLDHETGALLLDATAGKVKLRKKRKDSGDCCDCNCWWFCDVCPCNLPDGNDPTNVYVPCSLFDPPAERLESIYVGEFDLCYRLLSEVSEVPPDEYVVQSIDRRHPDCNDCCPDPCTECAAQCGTTKTFTLLLLEGIGPDGKEYQVSYVGELLLLQNQDCIYARAIPGNHDDLFYFVDGERQRFSSATFSVRCTCKFNAFGVWDVDVTYTFAGGTIWVAQWDHPEQFRRCPPIGSNAFNFNKWEQPDSGAEWTVTNEGTMTIGNP